MYFRVYTRAFPYLNIEVTARACLVTKRYRNACTRANRRAITLGADVGVRLVCEYVCILLHPYVHPDDTYLWWNVCWVAECVQLNSGAENEEEGGGREGLFAKQMVRRGSKWQRQPRTRLISSFWISRLYLLGIVKPNASRCLASDKLSDKSKIRIFKMWDSFSRVRLSRGLSKESTIQVLWK